MTFGKTYEIQGVETGRVDNGHVIRCVNARCRDIGSSTGKFHQGYESKCMIMSMSSGLQEIS